MLGQPVRAPADITLGCPPALRTRRLAGPVRVPPVTGDLLMASYEHAFILLTNR